jgi:hypothetical protein
MGDKGFANELRREQLKSLKSDRRLGLFGAIMSGLRTLVAVVKAIAWLLSR